MSTIEAVVLAVVEGLTEFIPVSSTGHMVMVSSFFGIADEPFTKFFEVAIQFGAILSVVVLYWRKFLNVANWQFYAKLLVAVIPALLLGYMFADKIDEMLGSPEIVAATIFAGGVLLLFMDGVFRKQKIKTEGEITYLNSFIIGLFQCIALIPGMSRSAMSIIGGMQQKLTRSLAAEFSFFLAVPTMAAAAGYKLMKAYSETPEIFSTGNNTTVFLLGNVIAFITAMFAIRLFIGLVQKYGFKYFGWYRIFIAIIFYMMIKLNQIR